MGGCGGTIGPQPMEGRIGAGGPMTGAGGLGIGWLGVSIGCGLGASELKKDMLACISPKRLEIRDME